MPPETFARRARMYAALGDPIRLQIVDELRGCDRTPRELERSLGVSSNLLSHHLDALQAVGLIERHRSSGDGRRRYVHLQLEALRATIPTPQARAEPALFICTGNSARSQLAAALWSTVTGAASASAGTHPAAAVHPGAVAAARRAGLDLTGARPSPPPAPEDVAGLVITVCDRAREELGSPAAWLHWSIADPVAAGTVAAFDATVTELRARIDDLAGAA